MTTLDQLQREGWLRAVDHAFALGLRRLRPDTADEVLVGAALASRALAFGHSALPLDQARALFAEIAADRDPPALPPRDAWRIALATSAWVAVRDAHAAQVREHGNAARMAGQDAAGPASAPAHAAVAQAQAGDSGGATSSATSDASSSAIRADDALAAHGTTPLVLDGSRLYLRRYWQYEVRLAHALHTRANTPPSLAGMRPAGAGGARPPAVAIAADALLARLFPQLEADPHDAQAAAARHLLHNDLLLLTGGPGTGKTTTVARALLLRCDAALRAGAPAPRIALAAPTGKAAARLGEAVHENLARLAGGGIADTLHPDAVAALQRAETLTLHRLLGWRPDAAEFRHDARHPLRHDLVVVDEASMVDLPLMAKLVDAVAPQAALLLVGDRDQLPSVETGDVLAALCDAADAGGPLAPHRIALARGWRQRGVDIPALAAQVRAGDADAVIDGLQRGQHGGIGWDGARDPASRIVAQALPGYRAVRDAASPADALALARRQRVLTAVREGPSGSVALNAGLADALRPAGHRGSALFHGALVMVVRNSYRHALYNGDIGIAWSESDGSLRVWFAREADAGASGDTLRAWLPAALPEHELAFALTVHKAQGSEFDHVMLVLPPAASGFARALSREGLYTGITRARHSLALFADPDALRAAIAQPAQRWSGLADRLHQPRAGNSDPRRS